MDKSRIKNFIIILLLLVNVFLLYIVISNFREERQAELYRKEALENVLSENGIKLNPNIELPDSIPPLVSLKRDTEIEQKLVSALIGKCDVKDLGGNIYFYEGPDGQAKFRGTGDFEILLNSGVIPKVKNPVDSARIALKKLGIECSDEDSSVNSEGGNTTVVLNCSWNGTPIYNSKISFYLTSEYLMLISGSRPLDKEYVIQSTENYTDSITLLMSFLKNVRETGEVCSEIKDMQIGYFLNSAVSGDCTLKPVWCIQTDSKAYYIDAQTGKAEKFEIAS